jgi:bifunctional non-homologous end joining protein LigD
MLWSPVKPLRARSKPVGFIAPCQAALTDKPPSGPDWSHEIKFDGYRLIARKDGDRVRLWARTTTDYTGSLPRIRAAVAALPVHSAVLDGEAIVLRPDATSDFHALRSAEGQARAVMIAFDLLEVDGEDIRRQPIEERRARLAAILKPRSVRVARRIADGIQRSEPIVGKGEAMFREACRMGLEGIVSKRIGSRYVSGRTRAWLKVKNPAFARPLQA